MRVLVTGANGFLGRHVVQALLRAGHAVTALARQQDPGAPVIAGLTWAQGDLLVPASLDAAVAGMQAVMHLALDMRAAPSAMFRSAVEGTTNLIQALPSTGVRLILASSFSVYDWPRVKDLLNEDSPTLDAASAPLYGGYAVAKVAQEALARALCAQRAIGLTILRPATIWGPGHPGLDVVGPGDAGKRYLFLPQRAAQLTYVDNCADAFVAALGDRAALGVFNVEDGFAPGVGEFAREVAPGLRTTDVPGWLMRCIMLAGPLARWGWRRGLPVPGLLIPERVAARFPVVRVDPTRARRDLGWTPRHGLREALALARQARS